MGYSTDKDCCFEDNEFWFRYRAAAIIIEEGCVLMAHNEKEDYYYSIGGGVHMGESSKDAVIREVKEETGVEYEACRLSFVNEVMYHGDGNLTGKDCHVIEFYYLMKPKGSKFKISDSNGDGECLKWLSLDDVKDNEKVFPILYRDKLSDMPDEIMHFIQDERECNLGC